MKRAGILFLATVLYILFGRSVFASSVLISQVKAGNASTARLIELYNNTDTTVDVTNWCTYYASASSNPATSASKFAANERACFRTASVSERLILPARSYIVISADIAGLTGDFTMTEGLGTGPAGHVFVADAGKVVQDTLGWGAAQYPEQAAVVVTQSPYILERKQTAPGTYLDTDNNAADFESLADIRAVYQTGALSRVTDFCLNIDAYQSTVPDGYVVDGQGNCMVSPGEQDGNVNPPAAVNDCSGLVVSEVGANLDSSTQFIEVYNSTLQTIPLQGCKLMTNRSTTSAYVFGDEALAPDHYKTVLIKDTPLTLTKTTTGTVYVLNPDGSEVDGRYYANLKADTSWAWFGSDGWSQTYHTTPGSVNVYQELPDCPVGQERNTETGRCRNLVEDQSVLQPCAEDQERSLETNRCRKVTTATTAVCQAGQERNPATNRCRKISTASATLKSCNADQERNPETNRCRKIASTSVTPCKEGQERNPDTNRCRKIIATNTGANPLSDTAKSNSIKLSSWVIATTGVAALCYGAYEYRQEAVTFLSRLRGKGRRGKPPG